MISEKDIQTIKKSPLFYGTQDSEVKAMLGCLSAHEAHYKKDSYIYREGDTIGDVGMVLSGCIYLISEDYWGNRTILSELETGDIFGEVYSCIETETLNISIVTAEESDILFINMKKITSVCTSACEFHNKLVRNLIRVLAEKAFALTKKIAHTSRRNTREKLLSYLSEQSKKSGSCSFEIPFNRQQLADYLSVDRSAMSTELSKMRDEGLIEFTKNKFTLFDETDSI